MENKKFYKFASSEGVQRNDVCGGSCSPCFGAGEQVTDAHGAVGLLE